MSANSGCGGFYYCRQQRSECVDRPSGSRNSHTHIIAVGALSVCGLMRIAVSSTNICPFCYRMDSWQAGFTYPHGGGGDPIWGPCINIYNLLFPPPCKSAHICLHFQFIRLCCFINAPLQVHFLWLWWISDCFLKMWNVCPMISYWINCAFLALVEIQTVITQPN